MEAKKLPTVRSVNRALSILKCFLVPPHEWGITEISNYVQLSKGTVHLLVKSLEEEGFLEQINRTRKYRLGSIVHDLSLATRVAGGDLRSIAHEFLKQLRYTVSLPCYLSVELGDQVIVIDKVEPTLPFMVIIQVGTALPYHSSAPGKLLLAYAPQERQNAIIHSLSFPTLTPNGITNKAQLKEELLSIVKDGYALDREETLTGLFCIGVPVRNSHGQVVACLSVSALSSSLSKDNYTEFLPPLQDYAERISQKLKVFP